MTVTLGHPDCSAGRPPEDLCHNWKRRTLIQKLRGRCVAQVMKAKPFKWVFDAFYVGPTFHIAADFSRTLNLTAR